MTINWAASLTCPIRAGIAAKLSAIDRWLFYSVVVQILALASSTKNDVTVKLPLGEIVGLVLVPSKGESVFVFRGIPYAQSPIGPLRFRAPKPRGPWKDQWDARQYRWACPQLGHLRAYSRENCLFLNVFTISMSPKAKLPVMVWLHGGEFATGSGMVGIPVEFLRQNVILVTINYRLGPLAFFSTDSWSAPGNLALLDQMLAFQWITDYIHFFGGDKEKVTVFGSGAGAVSASLHSISPLSKDYFCKMILQSGSAFQPGTVNDAINDASSARLAINSGCATPEDWSADPTDSLECLRSRRVESILEYGSLSTEFSSTEELFWAFREDGKFITGPPERMAATRPVKDVIIGMNRDEYGSKLHALLKEDAKHGDAFSEATLHDDIYRLATRWPLSQRTIINRLATSVYADAVSSRVEAKDSLFWLHQTQSLYSEGWYGGGVFQEASSLKFIGSKVYLYQFDYVSHNALWDTILRGVFKSWEVPYLFSTPGNVSWLAAEDFSPSSADLKMSQVLIQMWTNFAKLGIASGSPLLLENSAGDQNQLASFWHLGRGGLAQHRETGYIVGLSILALLTVCLFLGLIWTVYFYDARHTRHYYTTSANIPKF